MKKAFGDDGSYRESRTSMDSSLNDSSAFNVSFTSLEMRSFNLTVGDAPCSAGPPVSLDWEYNADSTTTYDVDSYERFRANEAPRRNKSELLMPASHRRDLLSKEWGYSRRQVDQAAIEARKVAEGRKKTRKNLKMQPVEEALENTKRKLSKWKSKISRSK